jgi:hypothetical protein
MSFFLIVAFNYWSPSRADQEPGATVEAVTRLAKLFSDMLKPFAEIGATAERQNFIDNLLKLNRDLFDLEQDKRYVVLALKRSPLNRSELQTASDSLAIKIDRTTLTLSSGRCGRSAAFLD